MTHVVSRAIVMSIAKSVRNVPFMMERLCDVDEAVRRAAFLHVSAVNVTQLKVRQRIHTLKVRTTVVYKWTPYWNSVLLAAFYAKPIFVPM